MLLIKVVIITESRDWYLKKEVIHTTLKYFLYKIIGPKGNQTQNYLRATLEETNASWAANSEKKRLRCMSQLLSKNKNNFEF